MYNNIDGFEPAVYIFYHDDVPSFGYVYSNERIDGKLTQVYINRDADVVLVKGDGTVVPINKITNKSNYICVRVRGYNYPIHALLMYTFKQSELPDDFLENKQRFNGKKDDAAYTIEHSNGCHYDNRLDNLEILSRRENRKRRHFGSRNTIDLERIGLNNARYSQRDTRRLHNDILKRDDKLLEELYGDEDDEFLERYL